MKVTRSMILFFVLFLMLLIVFLHEGIEGFLCSKQFVEEERSKEENRSKDQE